MMPHIVFLLLIASSPFYAQGDETASWGSISSGPSESECRPYIEKALQGASVTDSPNIENDADDVGDPTDEPKTLSEVSESESSEIPSDSEGQVTEIVDNDKSESTESGEKETKEESAEDEGTPENEEELSGEVQNESEINEESSTEAQGENNSEELSSETINEEALNATEETKEEDEVQSGASSVEEIEIDESVQNEETENVTKEVSGEESTEEGDVQIETSGSVEEEAASEEETPASLEEAQVLEDTTDGSQEISEVNPVEVEESQEEELPKDTLGSEESLEEETPTEAVDEAELIQEDTSEEKLESSGEQTTSDSTQNIDTQGNQSTEQEPQESQKSEESVATEESSEVTEEPSNTDDEQQSDKSEENEQESGIELDELIKESEENVAEAENQSTRDETSEESEGESTNESVVVGAEQTDRLESEGKTADKGEPDEEPQIAETSEGSGEASVDGDSSEPVQAESNGGESTQVDGDGSESENSTSEGEGVREQPTPEEELSMDVEIPEVLRARDHMSQILQLSAENEEQESLLGKTAEHTLRELKKLYDVAIKPLEMLYRYRDLSNRHFGDPEIFSKPLILFMGPWSGGKSTIINYLLENEYKNTALRTGAEPSPAYFNIVMWGEQEEVLDGTQLAADWTFSGLQKFGQGLLDRLRGLKLKHPLLEKVNIVEIPGILEIRKQVERLFPFNDACQWFIDRADIIFLVYDPSKLDVGPETEAILDQLKGREMQTRIILNKADQVKPEELMRVQGTLIWNISPLMSSTEPPVMYSTSLWSIPYEVGAPTRLLHAQERAFLKDLRGAIDKRVENKIASARRFAVRVRNHAKMVDCYLTTYYNHKSFFGNKKKISEDIIEHPQNYHIYEGLSTLTNISRYDLPDPDVYRDFFRLNPVYEFQQLSSTCTYFRGCPINRLDVAIAYDLPELIGKYKKSVENVLSSLKK